MFAMWFLELPSMDKYQILQFVIVFCGRHTVCNKMDLNDLTETFYSKKILGINIATKKSLAQNM